MLNAGVQESKISLGTVETVPDEDEALLDGGVMKAVWSAPPMKGLNLSFWLLTHSLVLDNVVVVEGVGALDTVPDPVNWVDCVDCDLTEPTE